MTTAAPPGRLTVTDVAAFIKAQGFDTFASKDGKLPALPNKLVVVTLIGGPGFSEDGAFDNVTFQLRFRGAQRVEDSAEDLAWTVDQMLVPPPGQPPLLPGPIGSQFVNRVSRAAGPPAFLTRDPAQRVHLVCSYIFKVARAAVPA